MTELQLLIRDSNTMPPVIRADYLEDHGYDLEAARIRLNEWNQNGTPDHLVARGMADGYIEEPVFYEPNQAYCFGTCIGACLDEYVPIVGYCDTMNFYHTWIARGFAWGDSADEF